MENYPNFSLQTNSWMPLRKDSLYRGGGNQNNLRVGCDQIFNNCVITPKKEIASCCGLTLEHIPEMRVGKIDDVACYSREQKNDFMKLWLRVEGPDLTPEIRAIVRMRFPLNLERRKSRDEEETVYRRADYWCAESA